MTELLTTNAEEEFSMPEACRALVEASPMAVALVAGASHSVQYVNPSFCSLVNQTRNNLIGKFFSGLMPAGVECLALLDRVARTGQSEMHTGQEHSAAHPFYWSYAMWPVLSSADRVVATMLVVTKSTLFHEQAIAMNQALIIGSVRQHQLTDIAEGQKEQLQVEITERKHMEKEMKRANDDLEQFAYSASHDLQEPLRTVSLYTQLLARKLTPHLDTEAEEYIQYILEGNERMSALIQDLLAYARAGAEEQHDQSTVECGLAIDQALANLNIRIQETQAIITSDPLPSVHADLPQLVQVFQNLIGNALKYRAPNGPPHIHIAAEHQGNEWVISVQDNGIGFDTRQAERIFGVFKRLHDNQQYPGTGIGLAICKRIVERHGGRIWATGEANKGATFFFTLPRKAEEAITPAVSITYSATSG